MKKYLFAALGAGLLMTSCQSDEPFAPGNGTAQQVAFTVSLPDAVSTRAGGTNSAAGGVSNNVGANVTFNVALYLGENLVYAHEQTVSSTGNHTSATFEPTLVIGEQYRVVAYAEFEKDVVATGEGVNPATNMGLIPVESGINNEKNDEYFVSTTLTAAPELSATLKRPYGKLRLVAEDLAEAERQFGANVESVEVTYKHTRPTNFNVIAGTFDPAYTEAAQTFTAAYGEYSNETDAARTIFVDYLPGKYDGSESMVPFTVTVKFEGGKTYTRDFRQDIPVKRNHLTTLKGRLFTIDSDLTLTIEEGFEGETESDFANDLEWVAANGGTVTLTEDVELPKSLIVADDISMIINLNGHKIINKSGSTELEEGDGIIVYGDLTINGEGTVQGNTRAVWARGNTGAKVRINGGNYVGAFDGNMTEVIYASGNGVIDIYGGTFEAKTEDTNSFAAPQYAVLNLHGNGKDGCDIKVYGGAFKNFNPADNISENPKHNFCAEGYIVFEDGEWYTVVAGTRATNEIELRNALKDENSDIVTIANDVNISGSSTPWLNIGREVEVTTEGNTLTVGNSANYGLFCNAGSDVTFRDANVVSAGGAIVARDGAQVAIESGSYAINSSSTSHRHMIYAYGNGTVVQINGGTFSFDQYRKRTYGCVLDGAVLYITGGTFGAAPNHPTDANNPFMTDGGQIIITGGTFGFNPSTWVAAGYVATKNGSTWTVSAE